MEVIVYMDPFRFGLNLKLMSNNTRPSGRINDDDVSLTFFDSTSTFIVSGTQFAPSFVLVRSEEWVWVRGDVQPKQDGVFIVAQRTNSRVSSLGSQHATTLPVPITD